MINFKLFHPFNFVLYKRPKIDAAWEPSDDLYQYGFSLDLTTEMYYYTYDWAMVLIVEYQDLVLR